MPVVDLTPQYRELGRLRLGEELDDRPTALEFWRLTSHHRDLLEAAATRYGGIVNPWTSPAGPAWELSTTSAELDVIVPPQDMAEGQFWELWKAGGVSRRCDGLTELLTGRPCLCGPDRGTDNRQYCKLITHLRVILPDLPDLGVWRLTTGSQNAARELLGALDVLSNLGPLPSAVLAIEDRTTKKAGSGRRRFVVPILRSRSSLLELAAEARDRTHVYQFEHAEPVAMIPASSYDPGPEPDPLTTPSEAPHSPATAREADIAATMPDPDLAPIWARLGDRLQSINPAEDPRDVLELMLPAIFTDAELVGIAEAPAYEAALDKWAGTTDPAVLNVDTFRTFASRVWIALSDRYRAHPAGRPYWVDDPATTVNYDHLGEEIN